MKHRGWIILSGVLWFFIGVTLLYKGLNFITESAFQANSLCMKLQNFGSPQQVATGFIGIGLLIGFFKGRFVLSKTVRRTVSHIAKLTLPIRFSQVYARAYWILIAVMMGLGFVLRFVPTEIRGLIDVAVGSALINGAMLYFRFAKATYGTDFPAQSP